MMEQKPDPFGGIKLKFKEIQQEVGTSANLDKIVEEYLVQKDWKLLEAYLRLKENYEQDVKIVGREVLKTGIVRSVNERSTEIEAEDREEVEKVSSNYLCGFIRGQIGVLFAKE